MNLPPRPNFTSGPSLAERFAQIDKVQNIDQLQYQRNDFNPIQYQQQEPQVDYLQQQLQKYHQNAGQFLPPEFSQRPTQQFYPPQNNQKPPTSQNYRQQSQGPHFQYSGNQVGNSQQQYPPPSSQGQRNDQSSQSRRIASSRSLAPSASGLNIGGRNIDSRDQPIRSSFQQVGQGIFQETPPSSHSQMRAVPRQREVLAPVHQLHPSFNYQHQGVISHHNSSSVNDLIKAQPQQIVQAPNHQSRVHRALDNKRMARHQMQNRKYNLRQVLMSELA